MSSTSMRLPLSPSVSRLVLVLPGADDACDALLFRVVGIRFSSFCARSSRRSCFSAKTYFAFQTCKRDGRLQSIARRESQAASAGSKSVRRRRPTLVSNKRETRMCGRQTLAKDETMWRSRAKGVAHRCACKMRGSTSVCCVCCARSAPPNREALCCCCASALSCAAISARRAFSAAGDRAALEVTVAARAACIRKAASRGKLAGKGSAATAGRVRSGDREEERAWREACCEADDPVRTCEATLLLLPFRACDAPAGTPNRSPSPPVLLVTLPDRLWMLERRGW